MLYNINLSTYKDSIYILSDYVRLTDYKRELVQQAHK